MEIKVRIMIYFFLYYRTQCILTSYVVCFWHLIELLDPETVMCDIRIKKQFAFGGGSENQSVSGVTTTCLTQCSISPSH